MASGKCTKGMPLSPFQLEVTRARKAEKRKRQRARRKHRAEQKLAVVWDRQRQAVAQSGMDVRSREFLASYEWRVLRMRVLKQYGARCMCCGATPADGVVMNVDHIKPRATHPHLALEFSNLQVLCNPCNHGKSNWDTTDWRKESSWIDEEERQAASHLRAIASG